MTIREETFPCGRNVYVWNNCKDCPDYPCKIIKKEQKK